MIGSSPSPTRKPTKKGEKEKEKNNRSTPAKKRTGQTPTARFLKSIFRPVLKGLYYLLHGMRSHKLLTLLMILLVFGTATPANYFKTRQFPFGAGHDHYIFHINA